MTLNCIYGTIDIILIIYLVIKSKHINASSFLTSTDFYIMNVLYVYQASFYVF